MRANICGTVIAALCVLLPLPVAGGQMAQQGHSIEECVATTIRPLMAQYDIPGMAVGIIIKGQASTYGYGVASKATGKLVDSMTLFEVGSVSKTFTATMASYAQVTGKLSLGDMVSKYVPSLRGTSFDKVSVLNLGTHTPGGFPLQLPDDIKTQEQLINYFQNWRPAYAPGTYRTYANPSVGLLGMVAAASMTQDFTAFVQDKLFAELGMGHTYLDVPENQLQNYAQGYSETDEPTRLNPGILLAETAGVGTNIGDLTRFVEANMGMVTLDGGLQQAITKTHTGYYRVGPMTQDLIWEQYPYPVTLQDLLAGNSEKIFMEPNPVLALNPAAPPGEDVFIDKTGSTNGFGAYVALIPAHKTGIVLLANKRYPIEARVTAAFQILHALE